MVPGVNTLLLNLPRRHVVSLSTPVTGRPISADILLNNLHSLLKVISYTPAVLFIFLHLANISKIVKIVNQRGINAQTNSHLWLQI